MTTTIINHPLIDHKMTILRNKETKIAEFKANLDQIALYLAYEVTKDLDTIDIMVATPICPTVGKKIAKPVVIIPILRAGLGLLDGFRQVIPDAKIGHIGLARNEETLQPEQYYAKLPQDLSNAIVIVVDPMLATGGSASATLDILKDKGAKDLRLACLVGAPQGIALIETNHPDVKVVLGCKDETLNEKGYIVPGLGDAGDRLFGTE